MADLQELARLNWVAAGRTDLLHAVVSATYDDGDWQIRDVILACGLQRPWVVIPGVCSRLELSRCKKCCKALGYPRGIGSPRNDAGCHRLLGIEVEKKAPACPNLMKALKSLLEPWPESPRKAIEPRPPDSKPMVAGERASARLMRQLLARYPRHCTPNQVGVAMVLHTLADHTALMAALEHRPDEASPWPQATSLGRWLHDVADDLETEAM